MKYYNIYFSVGDNVTFVTMLNYEHAISAVCLDFYNMLRKMGATNGLIRAYEVIQTFVTVTNTEIGFVRLCDDEFTYREIYT